MAEGFVELLAPCPLYALSTGPDDTIVVSGGGGGGNHGVHNLMTEVRYNAGRLEQVGGSDTGKDAVMNLSCHPENGNVVLGGMGDSCITYRFSNGEFVQVGRQKTDFHEKEPRQKKVVFNSLGTIFATAGEDSCVRIWRFAGESGGASKKLHTLSGHTKSVSDIDFNPYGSVLVSVSKDDKTLKLWQTASGRLLKDIPASSIRDGVTVFSAKFSRDGGFIFVGLTLPRVGSFIARLNAETGDLLNMAQVHAEALTAMTVSKSGRYVGYGTNDGTVGAVTSHLDKVVEAPRRHGFIVTGVSFHSGDQRLLSVSADGFLKATPVRPRRKGPKPKLVIAAILLIALILILLLTRR